MLSVAILDQASLLSLQLSQMVKWQATPFIVKKAFWVLKVGGFERLGPVFRAVRRGSYLAECKASSALVAEILGLRIGSRNRVQLVC